MGLLLPTEITAQPVITKRPIDETLEERRDEMLQRQEATLQQAEALNDEVRDSEDRVRSIRELDRQREAQIEQQKDLMRQRIWNNAIQDINRTVAESVASTAPPRKERYIPPPRGSGSSEPASSPTRSAAADRSGGAGSASARRTAEVRFADTEANKSAGDMNYVPYEDTIEWAAQSVICVTEMGFVDRPGGKQRLEYVVSHSSVASWPYSIFDEHTNQIQRRTIDEIKRKLHHHLSTRADQEAMATMDCVPYGAGGDTRQDALRAAEERKEQALEEISSRADDYRFFELAFVFTGASSPYRRRDRELRNFYDEYVASRTE